ncbi:MAG TPA: ABC transporter permease [Gaiellaceae bacterium]|nr:ABC transporter permease [Gaiellaceae bacterium]
MKRWLSIFFVGGVIAYRGLFNWIRPAMYIPTMLGSPLFQLIFFTKLGQYAHAESRDFYIVGNSIQVCAMSSVYGMTMAVANERWFGTLGPLLASPANRAAVFLGRGVPVLANGLLVSAFTFGIGVLLGFRPPVSAVPALALIVVVTTTSCTAFGMLLGSIGLRAKDFWFAANMAYFLMLLFCGVNIPLGDLPGWMSFVGRCLPLTHGIEAARRVSDGASLGSVAGLVGTELLVGACYAAAAFMLFRVLEHESRRSAVLDAY